MRDLKYLKLVLPACKEQNPCLRWNTKETSVITAANFRLFVHRRWDSQAIEAVDTDGGSGEFYTILLHIK